MHPGPFCFVQLPVLDAVPVTLDASFMRLRAKTILVMVVGLAWGLPLIAVAVLLAGGGHGWITPFWISLAGVAIYPVVVFRLSSFWDRRFGIDIGLLLIGAILNIAIYLLTKWEGVQYFYRVGEGAYIWMGLWAVWQLALIFKLVMVALTSRNGSRS